MLAWQAFAPPELLAAWREHITPASRRGPMLRGVTTRDAWLMDVHRSARGPLRARSESPAFESLRSKAFALGLVLKLMLTGSLGLPPARAANADALTTCPGCLPG